MINQECLAILLRWYRWGGGGGESTASTFQQENVLYVQVLQKSGLCICKESEQTSLGVTQLTAQFN